MSGITSEYKRLVMEVAGNMPKPIQATFNKLRNKINPGSSDYHPKSPYPGKAECMLCQHFDDKNKYCKVLNMRTDKASWCLYFTKKLSNTAVPSRTQTAQPQPAQAQAAQPQAAQPQVAQPQVAQPTTTS